MTNPMDDPFAVTVDEEDPFASADDFKSASGPFVPWPGIEILEGKLIVAVPRSFDANAKVSQYLQDTYSLPAEREEWKADLVVLDGGPFSYEYRGKEDKDSTDYVIKTWEVNELPFVIPNFRITWANVIGAMNKIAGGVKPMGIGRIRAGYTAKEMRAGKTFEDFAAEVAAWETKAKTNPKAAGPAPKARWHFVPSDAPADRALAMAWWTKARADGSFSI